jgi:hypothetical protein
MGNAVYNAVCFNDLWAILTLAGLGVLMLGVYLNAWFLVLLRRPRDIPLEPEPAKPFVDPRDEFEKAEELRLKVIADETKAAIKLPAESEESYELRPVQRSTVPNWKLKLDERRKSRLAFSSSGSLQKPQLVINAETEESMPPSNGTPSNGTPSTSSNSTSSNSISSNGSSHDPDENEVSGDS